MWREEAADVPDATDANTPLKDKLKPREFPAIFPRASRP